MAVEILSNNDGIFDCQKCDEKLKEERGHYKDGIVPFWVQGKVIRRCPLTLITPLSYEYIKAFSFYESGFLPNGNGWINESHKVIEAFIIITNASKTSNNIEKDNGRYRLKPNSKIKR